MSRASTSSSNNESVGLASWPAARHTLFLRVHSADKLQLATSQSSYCKVYLGDSPVVNAPHSTVSSMFLTDRANLPEHRSFHTKVCTSQVKTVALWNEKFEVPVENVKKEILSIRVKSQHPLYSPSIGSCAIQLKQLRPGTTVDQNFPLFKGDKTVGAIRLQLMIRENGAVDEPVQKKAPKSKKSKEIDHRSEDERALEEENKQFLRRQREKEEQLAREKKRIEEEMERLRREEEDRARRQREEEERRRLEAERLAAIEAEKQRVKDEKLRQKALKKEQEEEIVRRLSESITRRKSMISNQASSSFDDQWRTSSEQTMSMVGDEEDEMSVDSMSRKSSKSTQGFNSMRRPSSGARSRRSTLSLTDMIDTVVQDALPTDSDDSDRLDTEDEKEFIQRIAKLKIKMIEKRKQRRAEREAAEQAEFKLKSEIKSKLKASSEKGKDKQRRRKKAAKSSSSSPSSSSCSSSSCCSSEEEEEEEEVKPVRKSVQVIKKKTKKKTGNQAEANRSSGMIQSLTPVQITKKTGRDQSNQLNVGQIFEAAVNVAKVVAFDDEEDSLVEDGIPDTMDALQSLVPIGKFFGQKLHEASAKVAQLNEPKQPTYYF